ncbi:hypothetical protein AB1Y20_015056 [Prymnesium parvum]|uniref:G domain-containing protein n=1 Tax=Prymnesium parvum TaxID=97485 RepID=A0AB34JZ07_PRYPA
MLQPLLLSLFVPRTRAVHLAAPLERAIRRRAPLCSAVSSPAPREERDFLVRNDRNDVEVLSCSNSQMLAQGLLELGELPHVCVAGESNAGKSSLINHLLRKKNLARASSVAGKTRSVDMMRVNHKLVVTDLPGLPSRDHQVAEIWERVWEPLVFDYIRQCDPLRAMIYVHDIRWKVSPRVRTFVREVQDAGVPVLLVLSKDDRLANELKSDEVGDREAEHNKRVTFARRVRRAMGFDGIHVHYSTESALAQSRNGRRTVLRHIERAVQAENKHEVMELFQQMADRQDKTAFT